MRRLRGAARGAAAIAALTAVFAATACGGRSEPAESEPRVELRVPALDGGEIDLARYRGDPVVVHVFAPGEPETARDVEQLNAVQEARDDVVVVGVALEPGGYNMLAAWRRGMGVEYLLGLASAPEEIRVAHIEPLRALPTTLVVSPDGRLTHRVERPLRSGELPDLLAPFESGGAADGLASRHRVLR